MKQKTFYIVSSSAALRFTGNFLADQGIHVVTSPGPDVTHLLLPVPSFSEDGRIRGGNLLEHILAELPDTVTVIGGNLTHPILKGYRTIDLLQDAGYLADNAAITAHCAIGIAANNLPTVFRDCPVLVIGWGRIGKCLAAQLKATGADVAVAARKEADRAILRALGYRTHIPDALCHELLRYRVIFNTAPVPILSEQQIVHCRPDCVKIDLASKTGIAGDDVIWARGLPARDAPEASGKLIAKTVIRLSAGKEQFV